MPRRVVERLKKDLRIVMVPFLGKLLIVGIVAVFLLIENHVLAYFPRIVTNVWHTILIGVIIYVIIRYTITFVRMVIRG